LQGTQCICSCVDLLVWRGFTVGERGAGVSHHTKRESDDGCFCSFVVELARSFALTTEKRRMASPAFAVELEKLDGPLILTAVPGPNSKAQLAKFAAGWGGTGAA
jgi:hypothetical protein